MKKFAVLLGCLLFAVAGVKMASAGPIIIDGTDSNDHGYFDGAANVRGWKYMQEALEHLSSQLDPNVAHVLVAVGVHDVAITVDNGCSLDPNRDHNAYQSIKSAFDHSSLAATWTFTTVTGMTAISNWLTNISTASTGILYFPTYNNLCGDIFPDELSVVNDQASDIARFVNGAGDPTKGGGLFTNSERNGSTGAASHGAYEWLTTLLPELVATGDGDYDTEVHLTPDGNAAFPGLTDPDLSTGPWHNWFEGNLGDLKVLATATSTVGMTRTVIIGGGAGTSFGTVDTSIRKTVTPSSTSIGQPVTFTLVVTSISTFSGTTASTVVVTDSLPAGLQLKSVQPSQGSCNAATPVVCNLGPMEDNEDATITIVVTPTQNGVFTNTASVISEHLDPNPANNQSSATVTVGGNNVPPVIVLTGVPVGTGIGGCALPGSPFTVTWTITNTGPGNYLGGVLTGTVTGSGSGPATAPVNPLGVGGVEDITYVAHTIAPLPYGQERITVTGQVENAVAEVAAHICAPDFRTSNATVKSWPVFSYEDITYTWHISNTGDAAANGATGIFTLPHVTANGYLTFSEVSSVSSGTVITDLANNRIIWQGNLAPGQGATVVINTHSIFGLEHGILESPFAVYHPWRPDFIGKATYLYPYKVLLIIIYKQSH